MKATIYILALVALSVFCYGCDSEASMKNAFHHVKNSAMTNVPCVAQFHSLFPEAYISLTTYKFKPERTAIAVQDVVYGRYHVCLTVKNIEVDSKYSIGGYGTPSIQLYEVLSVEDRNGQIDYRYGKHYAISPEQWKEIVAKHGDFTVAGSDIRTNDPVSGIEILKTEAHTPAYGGW